jgi:hypothetical protein
MIPAFHAYSFSNDNRMELDIEEKIALYCSATQWEKLYGPIDLICDVHFFNYVLREGLDDLYMNIVALPEGEDVVEQGLKTAPIGHVYLGIDVVVAPEMAEFRYKNLFQAKGPDDISKLNGLPEYPIVDGVKFLDEIPEFISISLPSTWTP